MARDIFQRVSVKRRLQALLQESRYKMAFQPILRFNRTAIVGYEALARFDDEKYLMPDVCFRDAMQVGLDYELERAVLECALCQLEDIPKSCFLSLNATPALIASGNLANILHGYPLDRLVIELTEHEPIFDYVILKNMLSPLRQSGLRLAVDDAGAGFASFWHVLQLKPDIIKLDARLVQNIDSDVTKKRLVEAVCDFAVSSGSQVLAEGVVTRDEFEALLSMKIEMAQGCFIGRPGPLPVQSEH